MLQEKLCLFCIFFSLFLITLFPVLLFWKEKQHIKMPCCSVSKSSSRWFSNPCEWLWYLINSHELSYKTLQWTSWTYWECSIIQKQMFCLSAPIFKEINLNGQLLVLYLKHKVIFIIKFHFRFHSDKKCVISISKALGKSWNWQCYKRSAEIHHELP